MAEPEKDEDLKTFDIYHFFSRKDVIAAIVLVTVILLYTLYKLLFAPVVA